MTPTEWRRRLLHILPGFLPLVLWYIPHHDPLSWDSRLYMAMIIVAIGAGTAVKYQQIARRGETMNAACILGYALPIFLLLMLIPAHAELGLTVLAVLAIGDGSATLGGNISTNAGGNRVVRYGMARDMVLGLEAVQADGTVLSSLGKIIKDNAGYNLKHMFIGSEGTLGVVTRLVLRLRPKPASQQTAYLALDEFEKLPQLLNFCSSRSGGGLSAFEVMWRDYYELVLATPGAAQPLPADYPYYVLMEVMGGDAAGDGDRFESMLAEAMENGLLVDAVIAKSEGERLAMWALRDDVESLDRWGPRVGFDVGLSIATMPDYLEEIDAPIVAQWPERRRAVFGHLGDGNLHIVYAVGANGANVKKIIDDAVYLPLASRGGSISAEHGIGLYKKDYLEVSRSAAEISLMRQLKTMMDPNNILNPGKIL